MRIHLEQFTTYTLDEILHRHKSQVYTAGIIYRCLYCNTRWIPDCALYTLWQRYLLSRMCILQSRTIYRLTKHDLKTSHIRDAGGLLRWIAVVSCFLHFSHEILYFVFRFSYLTFLMSYFVILIEETTWEDGMIALGCSVGIEIRIV